MVYSLWFMVYGLWFAGAALKETGWRRMIRQNFKHSLFPIAYCLLTIAYCPIEPHKAQ